MSHCPETCVLMRKTKKELVEINRALVSRNLALIDENEALRVAKTEDTTTAYITRGGANIAEFQVKKLAPGTIVPQQNPDKRSWFERFFQ